jgi:soluble lytic murein transglycosylase-like protein
MFFRITKLLFRHGRRGPLPLAGVPAWPGVASPGAIGQPGDGPPDGLRLQLRRWAGLLALAGLTLPGTATAGVPVPWTGAGRATRPSGAEAPAPAVAELPLLLGHPWEAVLVEPRLEAPLSAAPWEAAAVEPDGTPLPAATGPRTPVPPEREYLRKPLVRYAQENGLPADLVMALAWKESSWRPRAVSRAGAIGVMQLMPSTVRFTSRNLMGLKHALDPRDAVANIRMGTRFLRHLVDRSGGHYRRALIAYNQGITSLEARGPYRESEGFADAVLALRSRFRRP